MKEIATETDGVYRIVLIHHVIGKNLEVSIKENHDPKIDQKVVINEGDRTAEVAGDEVTRGVHLGIDTIDQGSHLSLNQRNIADHHRETVVYLGPGQEVDLDILRLNKEVKDLRVQIHQKMINR